MTFLAELKRRNVLRMAGLYLVAAWLITQVASTVLPAFDAPGWALRAVISTLVAGFLPMMILSWVFELTPEGLKRETEVDRSQSITPLTGKKLDQIIIVVLALALAYFAFDKFALAPQRELVVRQQNEAEVSAARTRGGIDALIHSYGDRSIAVMPFVNMSPDPEQEYFSDGISEELLNQLTRIAQLRVIARTSSFAYKGKEVKVEQIAKELNVAHILEGSIRRSGTKVRITAQLIRAADSSHLWSETYDREMTDIFAVQDEIAAAVVAQLKLKLLRAAPTAKVVDPKAYELFLQARALIRQRTADAYTGAIDMLQRALAIDPAYAAAWTQLARVYSAQADNGLRPISEGYRLAREAGNKALASDPDFALALSHLAWIAMSYDGDFAAAAQHLTRALVLARDDLSVLNISAAFTQSLGRLQPAIAIREWLTARDPANPVLVANLGLAYYQAGRWDEAIARYRQALALSPQAVVYHYQIGMALLQRGQAQAAFAEMQLEPDGPWRQIGLPMVWHALGDKAQSAAALADLIHKYEKEMSYNIAYVHAWCNEFELAFEWLDKAVAYQDAGLSEIVLQPEFAKLRDDPRWLLFLHKLGKSPEQLAAIKFDLLLPQTGATIP